jgi:DNA-directed RNA polymerase specialized sigma24 family protein
MHKALQIYLHPVMIRAICYYTRDHDSADDIVQDCWYTIIEKLGGLDLKIRMGIQLLSSAQRIVLEMFYLENLSLREISDVLNIPEGTVKSRLFHAREKLKNIIINHMEDEHEKRRN